MFTELLDCGHRESPHSSITTGYGTDSKGAKHCYECCANRDREQMRRDGRIVLYLSLEDDTGRTVNQFGTRYGRHKITNWPGSLELPCYSVRKGRHNIAGSRYDFWFQFENTQWHGVQYGENTQLARCKRIKQISP